MKPNPLSALNHLTVPVAILVLRALVLRTRKKLSNDCGRWHCVSPSRMLEPERTVQQCAGGQRSGNPAASLAPGRLRRPRRIELALLFGHLPHRERTGFELSLDLLQLLEPLRGSSVSLRRHPTILVCRRPLCTLEAFLGGAGGLLERGETSRAGRPLAVGLGPVERISLAVIARVRPQNLDLPRAGRHTPRLRASSLRARAISTGSVRRRSSATRSSCSTFCRSKASWSPSRAASRCSIRCSRTSTRDSGLTSLGGSREGARGRALLSSRRRSTIAFTSPLAGRPPRASSSRRSLLLVRVSPTLFSGVARGQEGMSPANDQAGPLAWPLVLSSAPARVGVRQPGAEVLRSGTRQATILLGAPFA